MCPFQKSGENASVVPFHIYFTMDYNHESPQTHFFVNSFKAYQSKFKASSFTMTANYEML